MTTAHGFTSWLPEMASTLMIRHLALERRCSSFNGDTKASWWAEWLRH